MKYLIDSIKSTLYTGIKYLTDRMKYVPYRQDKIPYRQHKKYLIYRIKYLIYRIKYLIDGTTGCSAGCQYHGSQGAHL